MKNKITHYVFLLFLAVSSSCGVKYELVPTDKSNELISLNKQNTFAFLGNSITHDGRYHGYFELFILTRYPEVDFNFVNAGVAGDQAGLAIKRLNDDVLVHRPDVVTVMFGMNDIDRDLYGVENLKIDSMVAKQNRKLVEYASNLDSLSGLITKSGAKLVLFTPSIYEQNAQKPGAPNMFGCNDALKKCASIVKNYQKANNTFLVDHFSVMDSLNNLLQMKNPDTTIVSNDRVHPQNTGHFIMASNIMEQLGFSPLVALVEIDVPRKKVKSANAEVNDLILNNETVQFRYKPEALPFPVENLNDVTDFLGFNQKMNRELFAVKGLSAGTYKLTIDSMEISVFSQEELENGINLSDYKTPQNKLSTQIGDLVEQKRELVSGKIRNIAFIEYFYATELQTIRDQTEAFRFLDDRLKQNSHLPYYGYLESQVNTYKEVKGNLPAIQEKIDSLNEKINEHRRSIPEFNFVLEPVIQDLTGK